MKMEDDTQTMLKAIQARAKECRGNWSAMHDILDYDIPALFNLVERLQSMVQKVRAQRDEQARTLLQGAEHLEHSIYRKARQLLQESDDDLKGE